MLRVTKAIGVALEDSLGICLAVFGAAANLSGMTFALPLEELTLLFLMLLDLGGNFLVVI
jgi:hypothetical protein